MEVTKNSKKAQVRLDVCWVYEPREEQGKLRGGKKESESLGKASRWEEGPGGPSLSAQGTKGLQVWAAARTKARRRE